MKITELLDLRSIDLNPQVSSKEEAIDHMVDLLDQSGKLKDRQVYKESVLNREAQKEISYNEFIQMLEDNKVESVTISTDRVNIKPKEEEKTNKLLYLYGSPSAVTYYTGKGL